MIKTVSRRCQGFIDISRHNPYSGEEIEILYGMLYDELSKNFDSSYIYDLFRDIHSLCMQGTITDGLSFDETEGFGIASDTHLYRLNFLQYLLINNKRVFLFLTQVPLDRVPLYINDPKLSLFAKWRLTINK
jgi:hypothetical protein